ncbi:MAG: hypothetical protein SGPRY_007128, partial [Prymnesium sp.]
AKSSEQVTPAPASRLRRTKPSPQKRSVQKRGLYEGQADVERDEGDEGDEGDEEENKRGPNRRTGSKGSRNTRSAPTYGAGGGGASAKGKETINAECDESHHPEGGACDAPCPLRRKSTGGVRSTAMAPRKLGAMGATSGVTQPAALQMYQMLDNMELEECDTFKESAHALLKELAGLLDDFYSVTQQAPHPHCLAPCFFRLFTHPLPWTPHAVTSFLLPRLAQASAPVYPPTRMAPT